jgi:hypothetical protein
MKVFIPSKDRASQLDLLLRSMQENLPNINFDVCVLYKMSSEEFGRGYRKLSQNKFGNVFFHLHEETDFQSQFTDYVYQFQDDNIMLVTDDSIFYRESLATEDDINEVMDEKVWSFSFRLGLNTTTQWYRSGLQQDHLDKLGYQLVSPYRISSEKYIRWNWKMRHPFENYGYMMSWDGHIYNGSDLLLLAQKYSFYNPRTFEDRATKDMSDRSLVTKKYMVALEKSCLFVNTINAVQEEAPPFGDKYQCSAEELNKRYLAGEVISMKPFRGLELSGSHDEIPLEFENGDI